MLNEIWKILSSGDSNESKDTIIKSISSSDIVKPVESKNNSVSTRNIFGYTENKGKTLRLKDIMGEWMFSEEGSVLTRIHSDNRITNQDIRSYFVYSSDNGQKRNYVLLNGQTITLFVKENIFHIQIGNSSIGNSSICYENYEWM